ncbi:MAG: hypothetical protein IPM88_20570 [Nitrospira sp.]|nr:hypothetical protein [Nitrospira sp.]
MNQGSDRLLLSLLLAFTTCTLLSPLEVLAAGPTGEPLTRQAFEQMIEQYIRSHPEVIEQSLQSLENKRAAEEQERQRAALATSASPALQRLPASPISGNPGDVTGRVLRLSLWLLQKSGIGLDPTATERRPSPCRIQRLPDSWRDIRIGGQGGTRLEPAG